MCCKPYKRLAYPKQEIPDAKFIFSGDIKSKKTYNNLQNIMKNLGIKESVVFTEFRDDIPEIIASFDVAVIASKGSEGSSRACYEYMAMKKPIVATEVGIMSELIENGINGFLIPSEDPAS